MSGSIWCGDVAAADARLFAGAYWYLFGISIGRELSRLPPSRLIRELEVVRSASNGLTFIRDLIYLPFVVVGQWMSEKYAKVNIVAMVLDMLIELPLKTVLRLVRQWGAFIDDRKDRI